MAGTKLLRIFAGSTLVGTAPNSIFTPTEVNNICSDTRVVREQKGFTSSATVIISKPNISMPLRKLLGYNDQTPGDPPQQPLSSTKRRRRPANYRKAKRARRRTQKHSRKQQH